MAKKQLAMIRVGLRRSCFLSISIAAGVFAAAISLAAETPHFMVALEDFDPISVRRDSVIAKNVLAEVSGELHRTGFGVFDETAVTLENFVQRRVRRSDAEIIDIARSIDKPPIDILMIFSIYTSAMKTADGNRLRIRLRGRLLQVETGRVLGIIRSSTPKKLVAPRYCYHECLVNFVANNSDILVHGLGSTVQILLGGTEGTRELSPESRQLKIPQGYSLTVLGFSKEETTDFGAALVSFPGSRDLRVLYSGVGRNEYWYDSDIQGDSLIRELNRSLDQLGISAFVMLTRNEVVIQKRAKRR